MDEETALLRDQFALAIEPSVVEALSPKGYGQKDWTPAKVIGGTIYAIADAIIAEFFSKLRAAK